MNINNVLSSPFELEDYLKAMGYYLGLDFYADEDSLYIEERYKGVVDSAYINDKVTLDNENGTDDLLMLYIVNKDKQHKHKLKELQKEFIGKVMEEQNCNIALIASHSESKDNWKLSLVVRDTQDNGKVGVVTPVNRYNYLLGVNEPVQTIISQLNSIKGRVCKDSLIEAFTVEPVTKEFHANYVTSIISIANEIQKSHIGDYTEIQSLYLAEFIMHRITFVYLIQKKGWLGKDNIASFGDLQYLNKLVSYGGNIYQDKLVKLFARLSDGKNKFTPDRINGLGIVPHINGGLFSKLGDIDSLGDKGNVNKLNLPNKVIIDVIENFNRFNFTIDETSADDTNISIDIDTIGLIFEDLRDRIHDDFKDNNDISRSLMSRKDNGIYHTPKDICYFMCNNVINRHIQNKTGLSEIVINNIKQAIVYSAEWEREKVYELLDFEKVTVSKKVYKQKEACESSSTKKTNKLFGFFSNFFSPQKEEDVKDSESEYEVLTYTTLKDEDMQKIQNMYDAITSMKILEPSVGSGAFLKVLLDEISKITYNLCMFLNYGDSFTSKLDVMKHVILNNLRGVDINKDAVALAKLNLWMGLIIEADYEECRLPNLEKVIVCGNTLNQGYFANNTFVHYGLPLYDDVEETKEKCKELLKTYYYANDATIKNQSDKELKQMQEVVFNRTMKKYDNSSIDFTAYSQYANDCFSAYIEFMDIMCEGGFDVVIGNPPYINSNKVTSMPNGKQLKEIYKAITNGVYTDKCDIYIAFYKMGLRMTKPSGLLYYITSNKWLSAQYGKQLRIDIRDNYDMISLIDFKGNRVFPSADVDTCITLIKNKKSNEGSQIEYVDGTEYTNNSLRISKGNSSKVKSDVKKVVKEKGKKKESKAKKVNKCLVETEWLDLKHKDLDLKLTPSRIRVGSYEYDVRSWRDFVSYSILALNQYTDGRLRELVLNGEISKVVCGDIPDGQKVSQWKIVESTDMKVHVHLSSSGCVSKVKSVLKKLEIESELVEVKTIK